MLYDAKLIARAIRSSGVCAENKLDESFAATLVYTKHLCALCGLCTGRLSIDYARFRYFAFK